MLTVELDSLDLQTGQTVLDLGCGRGRHLHALTLKADVFSVGLDLSEDDVRATRNGFAERPACPGADMRYGLTVGDALRLPFAAASFDHVICSEVLEHIPDYSQVVHEIMRVTKPDGTVCVSVPRFWPEWLCWRLSDGYHSEPGGHVRIFRVADLKAAFRRAGARFRRRHWAHGLHSPYWWLKCALWQSRDSHPLIRLYHRFLVWDILKRPALTRLLDRLANPLMGKSVVLYFRKAAR